MSDAASFAELEGQHVELLPARTVLSTFSAQGIDGGTAENGAPGAGNVSLNVAGIPVIPGNSNGVGSPGASANGS